MGFRVYGLGILQLRSYPGLDTGYIDIDTGSDVDIDV